MCGRFKAGFEFRDIRIHWNVLNDLYYNAHYHIAPTQTHPIIVERAGAVEAWPMRWGLVPYWTKDQAGNKMINARSETLAERVAFLV
jgi:putative SOS response-associated peptidase YedK